MICIEKVSRPEPGMNAVDSPAVLTPRLVFLAIWIIATFATFRTRDINDILGSSAVDLQVLFQSISWLIFSILASILYVVKGFDWGLVKSGPLSWYVVFSLLAAFSIVYSNISIITIYYVLQMLTLVAIVGGIGNKVDTIYNLILLYVAINWLFLLLGAFELNFGFDWITTAEVSYARYGGSNGELWRFSTSFGHPSHVSIVAAIAAVGLAAQPKTSLVRQVLIVWLVSTVILTLSRTAIAGLLAGFVVIAWHRQSASIAISAICLTCAAILCIPGAGDWFVGLFMRGQSTAEFTSLTGRSEIYAVALERASNAWFGEGFRALRGNPLMGQRWGQGVLHAHNLVLQAFIDLGFAGAIAVVLCLTSFFALAVRLWWPSLRERSQGKRSDPEGLAVAFPILAFCILDSGFAVSVNIFVIVFVMLSAKLHRKLIAAATPRLELNEIQAPTINFIAGQRIGPSWSRSQWLR